MPLHSFSNVGRGGNSGRAILRIYNALRKGFDAVFAGFAEIDEADTTNEHEVLGRTFRGWARVAFTTRVPLLWQGAVWKKVGEFNIEGHPGIPHVSPERRIVGAMYQQRLTRRKLARWNTHTVAGAWNDKQEKNQDIRREFWLLLWGRLCEVNRKLVADGYDVVGSADLNRSHSLPVKQLHQNAVIVVHHVTDYIIATPAKGHRVKYIVLPPVDTDIDFHTLLRAQITFPRA